MKAAAATLITGILLVALSAGCIPEKRIVWSPDGKRAAVATPNGLFLIDREGKVRKPRLTGTTAKCDWFPDSRRLAVVRETAATNWTEVADIFSAEQTNTIKDLAKTLRERVLAYEGDWDKFQLDPENKISSGIEIAALLYMRDNLSEGLPEKLGEKWKDAEELRPDVYQLQVFTVTEDELEAGKVLVRTFQEIYQPKIAPNGGNIAFLMSPVGGTNDEPALHVVAREGGKARVIARNVALTHDWSPDGCCLVFIQSSAPSFAHQHDVQLGSLVTIRVAEDSGSLLPEPEAQGDLVGLLFNPFLAVRWLSDGKLLFSSFEATLPATTHDMPQRWSLFVFDPRMPASVHRVLGRDFAEPLEPSTPLFQVSPDEKRVLLPGPRGEVVLHNFASGETKSLVDMGTSKGIMKSLPTWRNNSQVCFVRPAGVEDEGFEVVLWQDGQAESISDSWSEEMKEGWLDAE